MIQGRLGLAACMHIYSNDLKFRPTPYSPIRFALSGKHPDCKAAYCGAALQSTHQTCLIGCQVRTELNLENPLSQMRGLTATIPLGTL